LGSIRGARRPWCSALGNDNPWADEFAVVTGASGSIGAAIADHLARLGARVGASDLTERAAAPVGDRRAFASVDVRRSAEVDAWIANLDRRWGSPTIGIICAGISRAGRLIETSDADWASVIDVNLTGAFYSARAVIRRMVAAGRGGRIVFVGSWAAHSPHPHIGAYSASKAGLRALAQTLALAPGIVDAGVSAQLFRSDPALERRTRAAIPDGSLISPDDVARDVAFLCSPDNRHTTGAVLVSDGGLSLASNMNPGTQRT
jgi:glucose 1-dehydrogenase